jgi:hypothetical protein
MRFLLFSIVVLFLSACKNTPKLENFDQNTWKKDKNACQNEREKMVQSIENQKDKILGISQMQVIELFGSPDYQQLQDRQQKFFYYYFQQGAQCNKAGQKTSKNASKNANINGNAIRVRFSALNAVSEVVRTEY